MPSPSISEPPRSVEVVDSTEILVCGGGPAGISAALAAARAGVKVTLLEANGCLGGVWTAGLLTYILDPKLESPITALLVERLEALKGKRERPTFASGSYEGGHHSFVYHPETMKLVLEQLCRENNIRVQLHTRLCAVYLRESGRREIDAVVSESKSGRQAWRAHQFIDASGDGDLSALAGCRFEVGRPENGETQPMTLMCLIHTPFPDRLAALSWGGSQSLIKDLKSRNVRTTYGSPIMFQIRDGLFAIMMNHHYGSGLDAASLTDNTFAARAEVHAILNTLSAQGGAWEGVQVAATAEHIGVREGRRIKGRYEITVEDLVAGRRHEDGICRVTFPIDVHSTSQKSGQPFDAENKIVSKPYDIPLRALIAADLDNLFLAGRCISGDFLAHSSYRVTGNAIVTGEAAGAHAAAICARSRR